MLIEQNKELAPLTTFGVSAKTRYFARYNSVDALRKIIQSDIFCNSEWLHIGAGSNLLFLGDYDGIVLKSDILERTAYKKDADTAFAIAGAGENWSDFVDWCVEQGLGGLENLANIPGEVGAAPVQNVGAYGVEAGNLIHSVEVMDVSNGEVIRLSAKDCGFAYRESHFKHKWKGKYIVLRVSFRLHISSEASMLDYGPLKSLKERLGHNPTIAEVRDEITSVRNSKLPNPALLGSAGSFFRNPVVDKYYFDEVIRPLANDIVCYPIGERSIKLAAGWLIEHSGMKGAKIGGAEVFPQQCLVIVNRHNATSADVANLATAVQHAVRKRFAVELQPEVNYISTHLDAEILGSGTSKGIPEIGCLCPVCTSEDQRDKRLRTSLLIHTHGLNLLIDPSPDFRQQALRAGITHLDAVLLTHSHYDHVGGIDDLRPFCFNNDVPIYAQEDVINDLKRRLDYCFRDTLYPGVPRLTLNTIEAYKSFTIDGATIHPLKVMHGKLPILGFRIGKFAYITDAHELPKQSMEQLLNLDALVLNALRHQPHFSHLSIEDACNISAKLKPQQTYLTHLCHQAGLHAEEDAKLPVGIHLAYDGLKIHCS